MPNRAMRRNKAYNTVNAALENNSKDVTKRNLTLFAWILWHDLGFGKDRLTRVMNLFYERSLQLAENSTWLDEAQAALERVLKDGDDSKNSV